MAGDNTALAEINKARQYLAQAKDITEVLHIRDKAVAMKAFATARGAEQAAADAAEIQLRCERKAGEFLREMKARGELKAGKPKDNALTLGALGIEHNESHRWQKIASIPEGKFEEYISDVKVATQSALLKVAKEYGLEEERIERDLDRIKKAEMTKITLYQDDIFKALPNVPDESIDILLTDPPYCIMKDYDWDKKDISFFDEWITAIKGKLKSKHTGFIFCDARLMHQVAPIISKHFSIKNTLIWIRKNMSMGRVINDRFISSYEVIFYFGTRPLNLPAEWGEERFDTQTVAVPQSNFAEGKYHPTQKPIELVEWLARVGSYDGDTILDPFAGSGTTGIACQGIKNRKCILIEKEREYCEIIRRRCGI